jgi:endonuclease/exonuclease/phosphatase family metal-dependent hydrolase
VSQPLRLVTCNLLHGRSLTDGQVDTQRMVSALSELRPDVLALQEVDRFQQRSHTVDQVAEIASGIEARSSGEHVSPKGRAYGQGASWRFVPAIMGVPGETWRPATDSDPATGHDLPGVDPSQPAYGTGLITTLPVISWHVIRVQPFPFRAPVFIPAAGGQWMMIDDEPRVCIAAVVEHAGRPMTIAATHASFVPGWNVPQLRKITRALKDLPAPQVLLGDLNLPAPLPGAVTRWKPLASGLPTFPSLNPKMQLDHVLLNDPGARLGFGATATAPTLAFSDHRPIVVDLR